ncbi:MAG: M23 family metallopeptidase [Gemmatimonadaceae bacterium]
MTSRSAHRRAVVALLAGTLLSNAGCSVFLAGGNPDRLPARRRAPARADAARAERPNVSREMAEAMRALDERHLMVPVDGVRAARVPDSFNEPRAGGRVHAAVDILAPKGTPVLAADDGRVIRLRSNAAGGITIYAVDADERFIYYYAHLDHYRDGLAEGMKVAKGEVIGYVGTTGNAPKDTPHLHFQVMLHSEGSAARWWDGPPLDPRPFFRMDGAQRQNER